MTLLRVVVDVLRPPIKHLAAEPLSDHHPLDAMPVSGAPEGFATGCVDELLQEPPGGVFVAMPAENRVDELTVLVNRSIAAGPAARHLHVRLVEVPGLPDTALAPGAKLVDYQRSEAELPAADGLVRDLVSTLEWQSGNVS